MQNQNISRQQIEERLQDTMRALSLIGEILVDESKYHMTSEEAVVQIRKVLYDKHPISSRRQLKELLDELSCIQEE